MRINRIYWEPGLEAAPARPETLPASNACPQPRRAGPAVRRLRLRLHPSGCADCPAGRQQPRASLNSPGRGLRRSPGEACRGVPAPSPPWCRMTVRARARRLMQHNAPAVSAVAGLGMAGFVGFFFAYRAALLTASGYVAAEVASLALYVSALVVGHLANPFARWRPKAEGCAPSACPPPQLAATDERQSLQVPSNSWTWPVSWNPNLSATSDCKSSIASN
jgi:hypothetical protein